MKYIKHPNGLITCQNDKCGEWHEGGHNIDDMLPDDTLHAISGVSLCMVCGGNVDWHDDDGNSCREGMAARIATKFGMIDGAHHKQWVINQMLRAILGVCAYEEWVNKMNSNPDYEPWDVGIAP